MLNDQLPCTQLTVNTSGANASVIIISQYSFQWNKLKASDVPELISNDWQVKNTRHKHFIHNWDMFYRGQGTCIWSSGFKDSAIFHMHHCSQAMPKPPYALFFYFLLHLRKCPLLTQLDDRVKASKGATLILFQTISDGSIRFQNSREMMKARNVFMELKAFMVDKLCKHIHTARGVTLKLLLMFNIHNNITM